MDNEKNMQELMDIGYEAALEEYGLIEHGEPLNLEMSHPIKRLATFKNWPSEFSAQKLVDTGFYYTGKCDHVFCFTCEAELGHWKAGDNVMEEHLKISPHCLFAKLNFGRGPRDAVSELP